MLRGNKRAGRVYPPYRFLHPQHRDDFTDSRRLGAARKGDADRLTYLGHLPAVFRADLLEQGIKLCR